jgi:sulfatase modifying factor 1
LEHLRLEACVSEREAKELMQVTRPAGLTIDAGINLAWVRLESAASAPPRPAEPISAAAPVTNPAGLAWQAAWMSSWGEDVFGRWASVSIAGVEHKFRWCPPGKFLMGSPKGEDGRYGEEGPQHEVELTQGFWIGEAPVTQRQWEAVTGSNPSGFKGPDLPVEQISWNDAQAWMSRANSGAGGVGVRFPTEAEWEYAARAGTTGATYRGGNDAATLDAIAWYGANSGVTTHPVKQKAPNPWGLYDTLGNVWEWCADDKRTYTSERAVNPHGGMGDGRVGRGGSWVDGARFARAARRRAYTPGGRDVLLGFRLARGQ